MTECALCGTPTDPDLIVAVRGLSDAPGVVYVCRDRCLDSVLRRHALRPPDPVTVGDRMAALFDDPEDTAA